MKTSQIEMLLYTVELGSIAEAARKLQKSRTTVSAALSTLEDELGVTLLVRTGNRITPTEIGESIVNDCQRMMVISNDIVSKCLQYNEGIASTIRVVRDDSLPEPIWRDILTRMSRKFPNTSISIYVAPSPELEEMVEQNVVDVAYGILPINSQLLHVQQNELGQIRMMSVAHKEHPLSQLRKVSPTDLESHTEIIVNYIDDDELMVFEPKSSKYIALTFYEHLRDAVLDKTGWSSVPALLINEHLRDGTLKVLKHNRAMNWQSFAEMTKTTMPRGVIIDWLSEQVEDYLLEVSE
ncbi:LysR family transcriptional regulator [Aliivibrio fischeri]|uniref:LysR family transcriptional regulator n=1 Tax=Aliivibrio fischeri TaxID=668 RepID=UPI0007C4908A|nr:LysR family transcriptional regulator [Aliivibrio fischeri]MBP3139670.1 LysR family transcriptional regulator [Aliivibrio fischeri]MBP3154055.1 LysR family transcriptional regulator [Aliivibrio fischeri]MCE7536324.1 LysR family transcriptional regulator [Aliivibrio fischeri]MCE7559110.1 LysR family transcriptional regulator [Aliivibrio fischeri]MCE7574797.1 LysR family transcriptional regulator [Aliivibrio fischeri]